MSLGLHPSIYFSHVVQCVIYISVTDLFMPLYFSATRT